jgi:hypothetical protein
MPGRVGVAHGVVQHVGVSVPIAGVAGLGDVLIKLGELVKIRLPDILNLIHLAYTNPGDVVLGFFPGYNTIFQNRIYLNI